MEEDKNFGIMTNDVQTQVTLTSDREEIARVPEASDLQGFLKRRQERNVRLAGLRPGFSAQGSFQRALLLLGGMAFPFQASKMPHDTKETGQGISGFKSKINLHFMF